MPGKIDTDSIIRGRENERKDEVLKASNADYVTQLEETTSLMPPEKPFETEASKNHIDTKEDGDSRYNDEFVQDVKESTNDIEKLDKTNETKLHLLNQEHKKIETKLSDGSINKKELASLESLISDVEDKIETYRSKLKAGTTGGGMFNEGGLLDGEGVEGTDVEGGENEGGILDGLDAGAILGATTLLAGKKDEEEEEEKESNEKEYD